MRNVEDLVVYYMVGGFASLAVWPENDLISVSKRPKAEPHSFTLQPCQLKKADVLIIFHWAG